VPSLLHRLYDSLNVEGLNGPQVDDLSLDTVPLLQLLGSSKGLADAAGQGDDCEILARAFNLGLAELRDCQI
jgi:hypothetical protein